MSCNIYEDPDLSQNVKYSKRPRKDGGDKVERLVDIYDSVDAGRHVSTQDGGAHTQNNLPSAQRNVLRAAALTLALLCLLLLVGVIVLSNLYISITLEKEDLQSRNEDLQSRYDNLSNSYCGETKTQTQGNITEWKRFRCSCYYKSTETKNWTESRRDCKNRGADLVIINNKVEQDFVSTLNKDGASWIGLQAEKNEWKYDWKWVDGSTLTHMAWKTGVNLKPAYGVESRAFSTLEGTWSQTNNGSKQWICEKEIHKV